MKVNSSGISIPIPRVVGLSENDAKARLSDAGFSCDVVYVEDSKIPSGQVKAVDPSENYKAHAGSSVKLYVSKGESPSVKVPNIIGESLESAKNILSSQGLSVSDIKYESSSKEKDTNI